MPLSPSLQSALRNALARRMVKLGLDVMLALAAWAISARIFTPGAPLTLRGALLWMLICLGVALALGLSRQHYRLVGFDDARRLGFATLLLCLIGGAVSMLAPHAGIHSFLAGRGFGAGLITGLAWMSLRGVVRLRHSDQARALSAKDQGAPARTLIIGAGRAGLLMAQEIQRHPKLGGQVVGYLDDALEKQGLKIQGIPVLGTTDLLTRIIAEQAIDQVVLAIPSAPGDFIRVLTRKLQDIPVKVKTVPGLFDLLGSRSWKPVLLDVSIEDLLRREPVVLDQSALGEALEEAVVLITGAGGSIGSELARQAAVFRPSRIILLGRGENSLWEAERSLREAFPNQSLALELCDIRNGRRLGQVFGRWRPEVVLHAAAHKHVPYLEAHPAEAVENNIFGTQRVLEAATAAGTRIFVNISTDKAVNPTNVLGATKRIAECLVLRAAQTAPAGTRYTSVRFGNVLGSRGSVVPIFKDQIRRGGPLTVTDPRMTRYFMTIPEASQLVLQAGILGDTGKVFVLDMGEPVKIVDLATDMIRLTGLMPESDIEIQFTGIRPGEKLYEELFNSEERRPTQVHAKVFEGIPEAPDPDRLEAGLDGLSAALAFPEGQRQREILAWLKRLVPSYAPARNGLARYEEGAAEIGRIHLPTGTNP